jgi:hypothetical protein
MKGGSEEAASQTLASEFGMDVDRDEMAAAQVAELGGREELSIPQADEQHLGVAEPLGEDRRRVGDLR